MTLFARVFLDSPVLETSIERAAAVDITLEQQTAIDSALDLTLWAGSDDLDAFENGLDADETVSRWVAVGGTDTRKLYQIRLTAEASSSIDYHRWTDGQAVFLSADREVRGWTVEAYFPERSVLRQFATASESNGVQFDLLEVSELKQLQDTQQFGLSEIQAQTLLTALARGYYSVPRKVNLEELAEPLGVSHQAVSERLRRGVGSLIESTAAAQFADGTKADAEGASSTGYTSQNPTLSRSVGLNLETP
ncbi:helix-turn-helix domain-containing protein [Halorubrum sp. HHNYT27]|uniref:helix-turn-helix domain-containing protein n=1 Tax=Halorubrum sp. HHNYT27 TaxID=3402275 RepID=UPI003EBF5098